MLEKRKVKVFSINSVPNPSLLLDRFSSLTKLICVLMYVTRFVSKCRRKLIEKNVSVTKSTEKDNVDLDVFELDQSFYLAIRMVQCRYFL